MVTLSAVPLFRFVVHKPTSQAETFPNRAFVAQLFQQWPSRSSSSTFLLIPVLTISILCFILPPSREAPPFTVKCSIRSCKERTLLACPRICFLCHNPPPNPSVPRVWTSDSYELLATKHTNLKEVKFGGQHGDSLEYK